MVIFVKIRDTEARVTGDTYPLRAKLGMNGLGFKFHRDKKEWRGKASLKNLESLQECSGAILSSEALALIRQFKASEEKRQAYLAGRVHAAKAL